VNPGRGDRPALRLCLLALLLILPLAYWPAWDDCFPLAKWLVLAAFGGAAVVLGGVLSAPLKWVPWWTGWVAVSVFGAGVTGWRALPEAALLVLPPLVACAAGAIEARKLAAALVVAGCLMAGWAALQFAGLEPGGWLSPFHKGVASTLGNPDLLGGALLLPFALALAGWAREPKRLASAAAAGLIGGGIVFTEARAAWLGAIVAAVAVLWRAPLRVRASAAVAAAFVFIIVLASPGVAGRMGSGGALRERIWTWGLSLEALWQHPIRGAGASAFRTVYLARQTAMHDRGATFSHYTEYAHFEPLHFAVELGVVGLGLWCWGLVAALRAWGSSPLRRTRPAVWAGTGAGALAILADAGLSWPWHVAPTIVPAWIMVGACCPAAPDPAIRAGSTARADGGGDPVTAAGGSGARVTAYMVAATVAGLAVLAVSFRLAYVSGSLRLGQALAVQGRFVEAGAVYDRAFRLRPGDVRLCWYAATAARGRGEPGTALGFVVRGLALEPDIAELRMEEAAIAKSRGDGAAAEAAYRAALRVHPGQAQAWNNLGNILGSRGRLAEAASAQRRAVELAPDMKEARQNLAITLIRLGRKAEARRVLEGKEP